MSDELESTSDEFIIKPFLNTEICRIIATKPLHWVLRFDSGVIVVIPKIKKEVVSEW